MTPPNSQDERRSTSSGTRRQAQSSSNLFRPSRQVPSSHETATTLVAREHHHTIVSCKAETVLISSAGDVLVCRDRETPYPRVSGQTAWSDYNWHQDLLGACCDAECDDLSASIQHAAACSPFCNDSSNGNGKNNNGSTSSASNHDQVFRTGLMGGAEVASPLHDNGLRGGGAFYSDHQTENDATFANQQYYHQSPQFNSNNNNNGNGNFEDTEDDSGFGDIAIVPIRSFDYSHFGEGGNDMIPEGSLQPVMELTPQNNTNPRNHYNKSNNKTGSSPHQNRATESAARAHFLHGVPTFVPEFSQVRVTQVSAHPLGSHVLIISDAGLLYSYGMNDCGQLGIGMRTPTVGDSRGYIMAPTIVTPLIENGGKTIACAAGVNHSLVVVMTEEQRLVKSRSFEHGTTRRKADVSGGDVSPSTESIVYHQMYGFGRNDYMKIGLVSSTIPEAGINEGTACVALPHRVALRCKIKADGTRFSQPQGIFDIAASVDHSAALVRRASGDVELYTWGNASHGALGLPHPIVGLDLRNDVNSEVQAVPVPSIVAAISCSSNPAARSVSLLLDDEGEYPVGLSLGQRCSFVVTSIGRCFSFGMSEEGMLGLGEGIAEAQTPTEVSFPEESRSEKIVSVSAGASHVVALTRSGNTFAWGHKEFAGLGLSPRNSSADESMHTAWSPEHLELPDRQQCSNGSNVSTCIVQACAGYDNSILVADTGRVYSCGRNSGRLGLGELTADVVGIPKPLFGGLRLWQQRQQEPPVRRKPPPTLKRGLTLG
jgi:alpha-tubulin suppressor-like RCC1 family protein